MADGINLDNYADLRDISRDFCAKVQAQAEGYLETLRHLFRPAAVFGAYMTGSHKDAPRDAALAISQFRSFYAEAAGSKPMLLDGALADQLEINFGTPVLNAYTYTHEVTTRTGPKTVTVTAPLTWVLSFPNYPFSRLREMLAMPKRPLDELRVIALHYAALHFVVMRNPQLLGLFQDLRFPIVSEKTAEFGGFPLLLLRAPAGTVRPPDEVIVQVIKYSGSDVVEEILDYQQWTNLSDPVAEMFRPVGESMQI